MQRAKSYFILVTNLFVVVIVVVVVLPHKVNEVDANNSR